MNFNPSYYANFLSRVGPSKLVYVSFHMLVSRVGHSKLHLNLTPICQLASTIERNMAWE